MLQGPCGPFFASLQKILHQNGWTVERVIFNAGDALWKGQTQKHIVFEGDSKDWELWLADLLDKNYIDIIIVFGAERPAHIVARTLACTCDVPVLCLEEGYLRPGYITAEWGGNNAASYLAESLPAPDWKASITTPTKDYKATLFMAFWAALYYTTRDLCSKQKQRSLFHRSTPLALEALSWIRNAALFIMNKRRAQKRIQDLTDTWARRYTFIPLQVQSDSNMGLSALGWTNARLIESAIKGFAAHAPLDHRLVFKIHPMARGHRNECAHIRHVADIYGITKRIDILDCGPLGPLAHFAYAMVTITSTSGLSALFHGTPLIVIGRTFYAHSDLCTRTLGQEPNWEQIFAHPPKVAPAALRKAYLAWVRQEALIAGDFYTPRGIEKAALGVLERLRTAI